MKEKIKAFFCVLFLVCALPYIITVCLQGETSSEDVIRKYDNRASETSKDSQQETTEPSLAEQTTFDIEEYLVGLLAEQMPANYELEALKAQAVIARTNLVAAMESNQEASFTKHNEELLNTWKETGADGNYKKLIKAVEKTKGQVMRYEGQCIYAAYHAVSAGTTRNAKEVMEGQKMPYLEGVESAMDIPSEDYLRVIFMDKKKFSEILKSISDENTIAEENPLEKFEVVSRDSADYVTAVKVGEKTITGEQFREAFELPSACFNIKEVEGEIRIVTKGLGHGLGMSQYGANVLAREGSDYRSILNYYFKNIEIQ